MSTQPRIFFNHSRHTFTIHRLDAAFDVLAFEGQEHLSQPFTYRIEFTCVEQDLSAEQILNKDARFSLYPLPPKPPYPGLPAPEYKPLRSLYGVVNSFQRLSSSRDEARYEITLQPR
ncbi:contractile injection system protein, VgrG/Pvc8 family, partial [Pseudomonas sp. MHK4]